MRVNSAIKAGAMPRRRYGPATARVVNVDLAALLLEFLQHIGGQPADYRALVEGGQSDERPAAQQPAQIGLAGARPAIGLRVAERLTEHRQQRIHQCIVAGFEEVDGYDKIGQLG